MYEPTLATVLAEVGPLPPRSILLGACDDKLHFYMDLTDPRPGSILIAGDPKSGKTRLLQAILASLEALNSPRQARFCLLASTLRAYGKIPEKPHCYLAELTSDAQVNALLTDLADLAERRWATRQSGPSIILAIDSLADLLPALDDHGLADLHWLLQNGPDVQVWPIATLTSGDAADMPAELLEDFPTRLVGRIQTADLAEQLAEDPDFPAINLKSGHQFAVWFEDQWLTFRIPSLGAKKQ
jgi:hypothetical protein